jgi:tRNA(Ile)-lysidine synthase TilS/MesJ
MGIERARRKVDHARRGFKPDALISFAREFGITHIVLGRPTPKQISNPFKRLLHGEKERPLYI